MMSERRIYGLLRFGLLRFSICLLLRSTYIESASLIYDEVDTVGDLKENDVYYGTGRIESCTAERLHVPEKRIRDCSREERAS